MTKDEFELALKERINRLWFDYEQIAEGLGVLNPLPITDEDLQLDEHIIKKILHFIFDIEELDYFDADTGEPDWERLIWLGQFIYSYEQEYKQ